MCAAALGRGPSKNIDSDGLIILGGKGNGLGKMHGGCLRVDGAKRVGWMGRTVCRERRGGKRSGIGGLRKEVEGGDVCRTGNRD